MKRTLLLTVCALALAAVPAVAAGPDLVVHVPAATNALISSVVAVPPGYTTLYVSGTIASADPAGAAGTPAAWGGDTERQTENALKKIDAVLATQHASLADVVMMHVSLVGDPAKGGALDFAGMNAAYNRHFGTPDQPNKPARSTVQVAGLAYPGVLVQIEMVAAVRAPR